MATPPEVLAAVQAAKGGYMQRKPAPAPGPQIFQGLNDAAAQGGPTATGKPAGRGGIASRPPSGPFLGFKPAGGPGGGPAGFRGGRMPVSPDKPQLDIRGPAGPRLQTGGGITSAAPQKLPWQVLAEAGLPGTGSAAGNREAAAKLQAGGGSGGSASGGIVMENPATTSKTFPGFKPAPGYAAWSGAKPSGAGPQIFQGLNDSADQANAATLGAGDPGFSARPQVNSISSAGPVGGGITGGAMPGPVSKEMPGAIPGEDVKAMAMPGTAQRPPAAGLGSTVSDPAAQMGGSGGFGDLAKIGAQFRRRPGQDFGTGQMGAEAL